MRQGANSEYEAEKKAEQEKQEKAIGLLTYLGQSVSEKHGNKMVLKMIFILHCFFF